MNERVNAVFKNTHVSVVQTEMRDAYGLTGLTKEVFLENFDAPFEEIFSETLQHLP